MTDSVSVREIARGTKNVSGPPYDISKVAEERRILNFSHSKNPREDPPFAFRELITSQRLHDPQINQTGTRDSWSNWVKDHFTSGLTKFEPDNEEDLFDAVLWNAREEKRIRAVGSGHSHSKVAAPDQSFIQLSNYPAQGALDGLIRELQTPWMKSGLLNQQNLVRVEAGATIKYLNRSLLKTGGQHTQGKALLNMGSFDAQTLAGAINTSTHGTGARLGSLADTVKSVELLTVEESPVQDGRPLVRKYRIEPESDSITDGREFEDGVASHDATLIQDDDIFHSAVVGYGVMGVAYSYTIEVRDGYFLHEQNLNKKWDQVKGNISTLISEPPRQQSFAKATASSNYPTGARHFQFRVNLPQVELGGKNKTKNPRCLVISHREAWKWPSAWGNSAPYDRWPSEPSYWNSKWNWPPERKTKSLQQFFRNQRKYNKGGFHPKRTPVMLPPGLNSRFQSSENKAPFEGALPSLSTHTDPGPNMTASYIALRRKVEERRNPERKPEAPPPAISTEIAVPAPQVQKAVEAVFEVVRKNEYAYNIPMGVRFVARSSHALSPEYATNPQNAPPVAKVEVPFFVRQFKNTFADIVTAYFSREDQLRHADNALQAVEDKLLNMADRGDLAFARPHMGKTNHLTRSDLQSMYPEFDTWEALHQHFDAFGTFNNGFARRKGIEIPRP